MNNEFVDVLSPPVGEQEYDEGHLARRSVITWPSTPDGQQLWKTMDQIIWLFRHGYQIYLKNSKLFYRAPSTVAQRDIELFVNVGSLKKWFEENKLYFAANFNQQTWLELSSAYLRVAVEAGRSLPMATIPIRIEGRLSVKRFIAAFKKLVKRTECLRSSFRRIGDQLIQVVHEDMELPIEVVSIGKGGDQIIERLLKSDAGRPFDIYDPPLFRIKLLRRTPRNHVLLLTFDHLITDALSVADLFRELVILYFTGSAIGKVVLPKRRSYSDYSIKMQELFFDESKMSALKQYWHRRLSKMPPSIPVTTESVNNAQDRQVFVKFRMPQSLAMKTHAQCQALGCSTQNFFLAAWFVLLHSISQKREVSTLILLSNRRSSKHTLGYCTDVVPAKMQIDLRCSFQKMITQTVKEILKIKKYGLLPAKMMFDGLENKDFVDSLTHFNFIRAPNRMRAGWLRFSLIEAPGTSFSNLEIRIMQHSTMEIEIFLFYKNSLFSEGQTAQLGRRYQRILEEAAEDPYANLEILVGAIETEMLTR